ncbi:Glucose-repressible alcohol dehydrogenase transcriptional effector [Tilletia horrida]|uniref:CCR4-Not complex 3'-5'-exoribonuclease subunit Ccr4 n=1 Tax=Tilletia horrida TaxID=155126 RepID=A0AAN6G8M4_9BASI|nr:Glucose-repressible alcohol dehydrogenase transcriptional effector [Tilletia horrida]
MFIHGHGHGSFGNLALGALGLGGGNGGGAGGNNGPGSQGGGGPGSGGGQNLSAGPSLGGGGSGSSGGGLGSAASSAFNPGGSSGNLLGSNGPPGMGPGSGAGGPGGSSSNLSHLPMTSHWQNQLLKAEISRQSSAPHHHARAAALAARSATSSAIAIQDPSAKAAATAAAAAATGASGSAPPANGLFVSKRDAPISGGGAPPTNNTSNGDSALASPKVTSAHANGSASGGKDGADAGPVQTWTTIDMGGLALKNLASDLFKYTFLTSLFVNHNALTVLSPAIVNLRNLTVLDASGNKLTSIPPELGMLTNLRELFLFDNALTTLPPELGTLHQLEMLGVEGNPLSDKLRTLIQREGTSALIAYLRDSCPVPLPPPEREWITIETDIVDSAGAGGASARAYGGAGSSIFVTEADKRNKAKSQKKKKTAAAKREGEEGGKGADADAEDADDDAEDGEGDDDDDDDDASTPEPSPESFNLLTYNILCDRYATQQMYGYTPSWALAWDYRKELILQEVMSYSADVCCLQEVDIEQYEDYFLHHLSQQDYEGVFWPKSRARTMRDDERRHVDGCAIFFKANKWALIEKRLIEFNQLALQRPDFKKTQDMFNRVMTKDQIAVIALLENRATGARLIVANAHIYWDPEFRDVKLVQVAMLMDELEKIAAQFAKLPPKLSSMLAEPYRKRGPPAYRDGTCIPTIICGDFNSVPDTGVYTFLRNGQISGDHEDFMSHTYGRYTSSGLEHKLSLRSAYEGIGELPFTNYTPNYKGVIDYVWYNTNALAVSGLLGDVDPAYRDKVVGFPNAHFPSDHVCLLAEFTLRPNAASTLNVGAGGAGGGSAVAAASKRIGSAAAANDDDGKGADGASLSNANANSSSSSTTTTGATTTTTTSGSGGGFGSSFSFGGLGSKLAAATNRRTFNPDFSTFGRAGSRS